MYCRNCGGPLNPDEPVCPACGTAYTPADPPPAVSPRKSSAGILFGLICGIAITAALTGALLLTGTVSLSSTQTGERGFDTPEAAAEAYLSALRSADAAGMMEVCAMEPYTEQYDMKASLMRIKMYHFNMAQRFPNETDFTRTLNLAQRRFYIAQTIGLQYLMLTQPESDLLSMAPVKIETERDANMLIEALGGAQNFETLRTLRLVEFIDPGELSDEYNSETNQKNLRRQEEVLGCKNLQSIAVKAEVGGKNYLFCFDVGQYDGKWYIINIGGNIAALAGALSDTGGVIPLSRPAFS